MGTNNDDPRGAGAPGYGRTPGRNFVTLSRARASPKSLTGRRFRAGTRRAVVGPDDLASSAPGEPPPARRRGHRALGRLRLPAAAPLRVLRHRPRRAVGAGGVPGAARP